MLNRVTLITALAATPWLASPPQEAPPAAGSAQQDPQPLWESAEQRLLFHAVLEGLYLDGVSNEVVDAALELDAELQWPRYFIYACPVCMPCFNAFRTYRARPVFYGDKAQRDTFGWGLPEAARAALLSTDPATRAAALQARVRVWVERKVDSLRLDERERVELEERLAVLRKQGYVLMQGYQRDERSAIYGHLETCPFCEGANEALLH